MYDRPAGRGKVDQGGASSGWDSRACGFGGGSSPGVVGTGNGTGVLGVGAPGVHALADAYLDTGAQGTNRGTVLGSTLFPAQGIGVHAECIDGGAGPAA